MRAAFRDVPIFFLRWLNATSTTLKKVASSSTLNGAFLGFGVRLHKFVQSDYMEITLGKHF